MKTFNMKTFKATHLFTAIILTITISCNSDDNDNTFIEADNDDETIVDDTDSNNDIDLTVYNKIYGTTATITSDGTFVTIKTNGTPDHKSAYYPTTNDLYEAYNGTTFSGVTFKKNPNEIGSFNYTFKIPLNPTEASNHAATSLGPIGVAINGVPLFNQYAGPNNQELTDEIFSFDKYHGHPTGASQYHYHVEPTYLTTVTSTKSGLIGFLLDGFPVYGPEEEDGTSISSTDLDAYHGHTHSTVDYPNGVYHYHFTPDAPYMNGNGYYGTPGTVTQ